ALLRARAVLRHVGRRLRPRVALVPYTTLFRSGRQDRNITVFKEVSRGHLDARIRAQRLVATYFAFVEMLSEVATRRWARIRASRDRKSTRLNSSHRHISYAVFCLTKKNQLSIA